MGVVNSQDSEFSKEMCRWNAHHTEYGPPGRPFEYREFPARLYKAGRNAQGRTAILDAATANDEDEARRLKALGFVMGGQGAAIEALEAQELYLAKLAAEINFDARRMSPQAKAEVDAAQAAAGARHLGEIPETPIPAHRKRGRPRSTTPKRRRRRPTVDTTPDPEVQP